MENTECAFPMGQNLIVALAPYRQEGHGNPPPGCFVSGGCNQHHALVLGHQRMHNDSVVLNRHAIQRGLGTSLSFHTRRFDVHPPCKLFASHPSIPGGLGVVIPGHAVHVNSVILAAHVPRSRWLSGIAIRWIRWLQMPHREGSRHPFYDAHRRTTSEFFTGWL